MSPSHTRSYLHQVPSVLLSPHEYFVPLILRLVSTGVYTDRSAASIDWGTVSTALSRCDRSSGSLDLYRPPRADGTTPIGAVAVGTTRSVPTAIGTGGLQLGVSS
jgi:hypothetical protein